MKFTLSSELPLWLIVACLTLGAGIAWLLYLSNRKREELSPVIRWILFGFRTASISLIAFLLLAPYVLSFDPMVEKPIVIIGEDHSASIPQLTDSSTLDSYRSQVDDLMTQYAEKFEFRTFSFGESVRTEIDTGYTDRLTDIAGFMDDVEDRFENRNVALLLLTTDGLYNKGENPVYRSSDFSYPVYTVAIGDTLKRIDLAVTKVQNNKLVFLGNQFETEIEVRAMLMNGHGAKLTIQKDGMIFHEQLIPVRGDDFKEQVKVMLPADVAGLQRFVVEVEPVDTEVNLVNNRRSFFIDVIEDQQKVLILAAAPHPDIRALLSAINGSRNYRATSSLAKEFKGKIVDYNLVILHQLPSGKEGMPQYLQAENQPPFLYIFGKQTSVNIFNNLGSGLTLEGNRGRFNEVLPLPVKNFATFSTGDDLADLLSQCPPLISPMATYHSDGSFQSFLNQRIGKVETPYPLVGFQDLEGRRTGVVTGEGIWRWRMFDYRLNNNTGRFDNLIRKWVQYLAVREDRSRFRVAVEPSWFEHENVVFEAEYYDKAYEPNSEQDIELTLQDAEGKSIEYRFLAVNDRYQADLGKLTEGTYRWTAKLNDGTESFSKSGSFTVKPLQLELSDLQADHDLLFNLSERHGGKVLSPGTLLQEVGQVLDENSFAPVLHYQERMKELISFEWLFFIILLMLTVEWAVRKWMGLR